MSGEGTLRLDPKGLLVEVSRASYAGGSLEASCRLDRLDRPPLPVKIALRGKGIDFEQFFADLGLPGTGLMARAGLDATLTFGPGGIEHADGAGRLTLTPDPGRTSAVQGRQSRFRSRAEGRSRIRDGRILFDKTAARDGGRREDPARRVAAPRLVGAGPHVRRVGGRPRRDRASRVELVRGDPEGASRAAAEARRLGPPLGAPHAGLRGPAHRGPARGVGLRPARRAIRRDVRELRRGPQRRDARAVRGARRGRRLHARRDGSGSAARSTASTAWTA